MLCTSTTLFPASRGDNVLLEWRLAEELWERRMIEGIFLVLIGDITPALTTRQTKHSLIILTMSRPAFKVTSKVLVIHGHSLPMFCVDSVEYKVCEHLTVVTNDD